MTSTERSNAPLGDVATKLLFEDGRVRIWELKLEPGEETPPHGDGPRIRIGQTEDILGGYVGI